MWSEAYHAAWGCRCCVPLDDAADGGEAHVEWSIYHLSGVALASTSKETLPVACQKGALTATASGAAGKSLLSLNMRRAATGWEQLMASGIQVDYMQERMCGRMEAWLEALRDLSPAWAPKRRGSVSKALVWPFSAYSHFGVQRVWSLGEYSQWADLCAALATLGVEVVLWPWKRRGLPKKRDFDAADVIFMDYDGIHSSWRKTSLPPADKTWILDTFGTDGTVVDHGFFGRQPPLTNFPLKRFLTFVPGYSSRNTFLGVAVLRPSDAAASEAAPPRRKWQCVLWSKVHPWLNEKNGFPAYHHALLREYTKHCHVVATIDKKDTYGTEAAIQSCCPEVEIRGVASPNEFLELLRSSAVYVGVGEPLIAPSCFEALSLGTHVVQPRFPALRVLKNKPITEGWTSQHPWLEKVPEPFVFTVDPRDLTASVARAFREIKLAFDSHFGEGDDDAGQPHLDAQALERFYVAGEYPNRDAYSIGGFLGRVGSIIQDTTRLEAKDWDWERSQHPQQLPQEWRNPPMAV